jgi:putative N6-adenine-specific DNA methylase
MAQKHRFKANREFKTRLEEESNNEEGDIRSFTFHKHEIGDFAGGRKRIDHDEKRGGFGGRRDDKRGGYGDRHDDKRGGFGGRRDDKRGSYGDRHDDKRGGYGDKRGGKKFEGKKFGSNDRRGSFDKRRNHSDSED